MNPEFEHLKDPFDRLNDLESGLTDLALNQEKMADHIRIQAKLIQDISENVRYLAKTNMFLIEQLGKIKENEKPE